MSRRELVLLGIGLKAGTCYFGGYSTRLRRLVGEENDATCYSFTTEEDTVKGGVNRLDVQVLSWEKSSIFYRITHSARMESCLCFVTRFPEAMKSVPEGT
ncbi:hypothetical protein CHS0354_016066 [Potamilus streckersoni]|uniref:Uncharacterized protein n=1 Tax=Potamilus streckersoni TaxID=2493646 RepID=A0AAE0T0U0_9BIVA|nr:hypothetical protein CHS0354_016066 [Potamilus streckersoni]